MYGVVIRHLSGIQKGIQYQHAVQEYANAFQKDKEHIQWAKEDKTAVILECHSTNNEISASNMAQMQTLLAELVGLEWKFASFKEPDLNDTMTSIVFLADDRVWDRENYPDWKTVVYESRLREDSALESESNPFYKVWLQRVGGPRIAQMKKILSPYKLASN